MKSFLLTFLVFTLLDTNVMDAQQSKSIQSNSEIDKLYKEYKDKDSIIIYTSGEELIGRIKITLNSDSLPQSIEISGDGDKNDIAEVFYNIIRQKKAKGYLISQGDNYEAGISPSGADYIALLMDDFIDKSGFNVVYKKGNMLFKLSSSKVEQTYYDFSLNRQTSIYFTFSMINEDYNRKGGKTKTEFKF